MNTLTPDERPTMTNPGPWAPPQGMPQPRAPKPAFQGLDTTLGVVMWLAVVIAALTGIAGLADDTPSLLVAAGSGLMVAIMCGVGRVLVHIARTLDRMAAMPPRVGP